MTTSVRLGASVALLAMVSCHPTEPADVPTWSHDAIWYQIFVERFRNGDPSNDPTAEDTYGAWQTSPEDWQPTPWTWDWYRQELWAEGRDFYTAVQMRRYGGDMQGVLDQLPYLEELGVTALYLNPINDAPSLHKFDARNYRHVDRNFGPDPEGDVRVMASEDPLDPETWLWTSADLLFLDVVREAHARGMRVIVDYSWNHTGREFWAFKDVMQHQAASRYAEWYDIASFDDQATPDTNEFRYDGWMGVQTLPELAKVGRDTTRGPHEGNLHPEVKQHVFHVTRRWMDPNGDGNPEDGIDGFRLDVAEMVPLGFWREYRQFVRSINPEAYLVGEVWWESWPHRMADPVPWVQGDVFDAVMHYRWYMPTRSLFAEAPPHLTPSQYVAHMDSIEQGIDGDFLKAMMNLTASHDTPRFGTSIYNPVLYKYRATPRADTAYKVNRPDARTWEIQKQILVQQFTYPGAPHVWNGDEVGMWGADDPDPRKPLVWADLQYEPETTYPDERTRQPDIVEPDTTKLAVYRQLIALRRAHADLFANGSVTYLVVDDNARVLVYERVLGSQRAIVAFNASDDPRTLDLQLNGYTEVYPGSAVPPNPVSLAPRSAHVWLGREG